MKNRLLNFFGLASLLLTVVSCSSGGGGGSPAAPAAPPPPQNKAEAIARLSNENKKNFDTWQWRVIKSCDAQQAFMATATNLDDMTAGVDGAAFLKTTNHTSVLADQNGFVVVGDYSTSSVQSTSTFNLSYTANGANYNMTATAVGDGSKCTISLYGIPVLELFIAPQFFVTAQWKQNTGHTASDASSVTQSIGMNGAAIGQQQALANAMNTWMAPDSSALAIVQQRLRLTNAEIEKFFKVAGFRANVAFQVNGEPSSLWATPKDGGLIARQDYLNQLYAVGQKKIKLTWLVNTPNLVFPDIRNDRDDGSLGLDTTLDVNVAATQVQYNVSQTDQLGLVAPDKDAAVRCARNRANAFRQTPLVNNTVTPSVSQMLFPCLTLSSDLVALSYSTGLMKQLIAQMLNFRPNSQVQFSGWDEVLMDLSMDSINTKKSIAAELDPQLVSPIIQSADQFVSAIQQGLSTTLNFTQTKDLAYRMGLRWATRGLDVPATRISRILSSIDHAIDIFPVSSKALLYDLGFQPLANDDLLDFAAQIDSAYKTEAMVAFNLAHQLDYSEFSADVFNQVLQKKIPLQDLQEWSKKLQVMQTEIVKYPGLQNFRGALVRASLKWMKSGQATPANLPAIYSALANVADVFPTSTQQLLNSISQSLDADRAAIEFAAAMTPEYKALAISIRDNAKACDFDNVANDFFGSVLQSRLDLAKLKMMDGFWSAAWAFTQREQARTAGDPTAKSQDPDRKDLLAQAATENWINSDFLALETIVSLGRLKTGCDNYKSVSTTARCVGGNLYSRQTGMFLDPAFANRYPALANDFLGYLNSVPGPENEMLRMNLLNGFFSNQPLWNTCNQLQFQAKAGELRTEIGDYTRTTDFATRFRVGNQIQTTLQGCQ